MLVDQPTTTVPVSAPGAFARTARTAIHAGATIIITYALSPFIAQRPLGATLYKIINHAGYVPWAVGFAAGLNADKLTITALAVGLAVTYWPDGLVSPGTAAITGVIAGLCIRRLIIGEHHG